MIADDETALVPVLDDIDDAPFSGAYVLGVDRAEAVIRQFLRQGSADDLGDWHEL